MAEKICLICQKRFTRPMKVSNYNWSRRVTCSHKCRLIKLKGQGELGLRDAFDRYADVGGPSDCWEWTGTITSDGYGRAQCAKEKWSAHRLSYHIFRGPIPNGLFICHTCDNKKCVNPSHLYAGTAQDNSNDAVERGLQPRGIDMHNSVLTPKDVREIRCSEKSSRALAKQFSVSQATIMKVLTGRTWGHVK